MENNLHEAHDQWAKRPEDERFTSLDLLEESVTKRRVQSREAVVRLGDLRFLNDEGFLQVAVDGQRMEPSHWAFGQLAGHLGAPAAFMRQLRPETAVAVLNERLDAARQDDEAKAMWRNTDDGTKILQAFTGPTYGRIWDADVVDMVKKVIDRTDGKFTNPPAYGPNGESVPSGLYASDRDAFIFMVDGGSLLDAGPRAQLNRGFFLWNSEVGSTSYGVTTFLFNVVCGNHIVWGAENVTNLRIIHSAGGPSRFLEEALPLLMDITKFEPDTGAIVEAQKIRLADLTYMGSLNMRTQEKEWAKVFGVKHKLTISEVKDAIAYADREEGGCETMWDIVMGLTASARDIPHLSTRTDLERRAGKLLG